MKASDNQVRDAAVKLAGGALMSVLASGLGLSSRQLRTRIRALGFEPAKGGRPRLPPKIRLEHCPTCRCKGRPEQPHGPSAGMSEVESR